MSDINLNRLWSVDIFGSNYRYTNLAEGLFGGSKEIMWPSALACRMNADGNAEFFISEYLGRIWKIKFEAEEFVRNRNVFSGTNNSGVGASRDRSLHKRYFFRCFSLFVTSCFVQQCKFSTIFNF